MTDPTQDDEKFIAYAGEVQVLKHKWSDAGGYTTELQCHEGDEGGHPLKRFPKGTRFHLVLLEVADDEEPIDQVAKARIEKHLKQATKGGRLARETGILCRHREFQLYLYHQEKIAPTWDEKLREQAARHYICQTVGIKSRAELDHDEHKAAVYRNQVVDPYLKWRRDNPDKLGEKTTRERTA